MSLLALLFVGAIATQNVEGDLAALARDHVNVARRDWGYSHATASSVYGPGYEADRAIDGRWANREGDKWNSAQGEGPHWLIVDLGHPFIIDAIALRHEGVYAEGDRYNTSDFELQWAASSSGPWTDLPPPVRGNRDNISILRFKPIRSRYVRFITEKGEQNGNNFGRLFEIEVYSPKDKIDVPLISLEWPQVPNFRHVGGRLESSVDVHSVPTTVLDRFKVNGRQASVRDGRLWLPVNGDQPAQVKFEQPTGPSPSWRMVDESSWIAGMKGGTIHLLSSSHQDVAWMDTPDWCRVNRVKGILEPAIDMMSRDARYRFTMENMLNLRELLAERPKRRGEIEKLIRSGQLEFGGTYNQPYESLLGGEQLIRQLYFGRRWLRNQFPGTDTCIAYTVDVPGRSLQMQQILAKSGIRYLVTSRYHEGLFRWGSPDGSSILVYALPHYGNHSGLLKEEPAAAVRDLPRAIKTVAEDFGKRGIPPHYMLLNSQDFEPPVDFGPLLDQWSKQPAIAFVDGKAIPPPSLNYSSTRGLFESLDTPTSKPKKVSGERPNMWLYIHGPTHQEAIQAQREAARLLPVAETFATMRCLVEGSFASYPAARLSNGWLDSLYPDHGFGGKNGHITDGVFHAKFASARDAARRALAESLPTLASHVKVDRTMGIPVVVFNPHSWVRSDTVSVEAPTKESGWGVVDGQGRSIPSQISTASQHVNVATTGLGSHVTRSTGTKVERLLAGDWWDARNGSWESPASPSQPATIEIDLGQVRTVDRILLRHYGAWGQFEKETNLNSRGFRVLGSADRGSRKIELAPVTLGNSLPISVLEFKPAQVRFLEVEIFEPNDHIDNIARLLGIEVYANVKPTRPTITFQATNLPSLGYRTFYLAKGTPSKTLVSTGAPSGQIENDFYRIQLKPGGVASIYDKQARRELFRKTGLTPGEVLTLNSVGNGAGEFGAVQQPTLEGFDRTSAHRPAWSYRADLSGSVSSTYELVQPIGGAKVRQRLVIYHRCKRIDFDIDLEGWNGDKYREFRVAFPIGGPHAKVSYEVPLGTVRIGEDEIKSTGGKAYGSLDYWQQCSEIHPREVQDFIRVHDTGLTTTVSSSVSVFDFIDPTGLAGKGPLIQTILLASRKSCHGEGNWYLQPGDHHFHFSISSALDPNSGWREAAEAQLPLMAVVPRTKNASLPSAMSFAGVSTPNVRISTIKKAEDDNSVVVRCYDVEGRSMTTLLKLFVPISTAHGCNMIEDEQKRLTARNGSVSLPIGKFAIETVKLRRR